jgi:hypothetical protein
MRKSHPGPARERSRVIVDVVAALDLADGKHTRVCVSAESPIPNGLTAVAADVVRSVTRIQERIEDVRGARTRYRFCKIQHGRIRHYLPT